MGQVWQGNSTIIRNPGSIFLSLCGLQYAASILWFKVAFSVPIVIWVYIPTSIKEKEAGGCTPLPSEGITRSCNHNSCSVPADQNSVTFHSWLKRSLFFLDIRDIFKEKKKRFYYNESKRQYWRTTGRFWHTWLKTLPHI